MRKVEEIKIDKNFPGLAGWMVQVRYDKGWNAQSEVDGQPIKTYDQALKAVVELVNNQMASKQEV